MNGFDVFDNLLIVEGQLELLTSIRIGTGRSYDATEPDQAVIKDVNGNPIIPGASLKGVLRSYTESLLRAIAVRAGNPMETLVRESLDDVVTDKFNEKYKDMADDEIIADIPILNRLFGSHHMGAKFLVRDLPVDSNYWGERYLLRDGVSIDRDTGIAADMRVYNFEVVPATTRFMFTAHIDNATDAERGLAMLALRALEGGRLQIGGGRSRGLGWCRLVDVNYTFHDNPVTYLLGEMGQEILADDDRFAAWVAALQNEVT